MKGNPSLLVADEPSTVPSLSSSGPYELTEDESQLAQLMHISPESAAPPSASQLLYHDNHNDDNTLQATTTRTSPLLSRLNNSPPPPPPPTVSIATIAGGSLLFVQVGLFWVSVMGGSSSSSSTSATAWFDVVLRVQVSWFRLALGTDATDTVLQRMNLGSILLSFLQTHQNAALVLVVLTCTVLPVLALIQQVVLFVQRHADFVAGRPGRQYRNYIDPLVRLAFLVVWLLLFMDLATSFIDLKWTGTVVSVQNRIQHGLVSYVLAATSMIAMAIVQRFGQDNIPTRRNTSTTTEFSPYMMEDEDNMDTIREPLLPADGTTEQEATTTTTAAATRCNGKPCMSKIVPILAFETGLLSVLLLVASFFEPLLTIRYSGIASQFMNCREQSLHLGQLPVLLWERGNAAQTEKWVLLAFGMVLLQLTLGLPLAALVCAVHRWTGRTSRQSRLWLKSLYPGSGPLVLALALLLVVPLLDHVPQYLFEQDTSSATLCDHVETLLDESCLVLKSQLGAGAWCFIAHSVLLEAFLLLSLR